MSAPAHALASGEAAGLVSVSTTRPQGVPAIIEWASNCITVDRELIRVTRLRKAVGVAAKCLKLNAARSDRLLMVTLTYAGDNSRWRPEHVSDYLQRVRKWFARLSGQKLRYVWVAELQERGVIHYHVIFWMPSGVTMPKADKRGWWPHGMTRTERVNHPVAYIMSYVSKIESKNVGSFPRGARISGSGGLDKESRDFKRWVLWPSYVQGNAACGDRWRPGKGGGFTNMETGEHLCSEWAPTGGGHRSFIRIHTHPRIVEASGPFSWVRGPIPGVRSASGIGSAITEGQP